MNFYNAKRTALQWSRRLLAVTAAGALLLQPLAEGSKVQAAAQTASAALPTLTVVSDQPITAGAQLKKVVWKSTRSGKEISTKGNVIEIDVQNPNVKLDVITGKGNQFTQRETVLNMAKETGAVAAINGDYFNTRSDGAPIGPQIANGQMMSTPSFLSGMYAFALSKDNQPIIDRFSFEGSILTMDGKSYPLAGMNKAYYIVEPSRMNSHVDTMFIYTSAWGQTGRAQDILSKPTEVLVQNGIITQISVNAPLPMIPPSDGYILWTSGKAADFVRMNLQVGDPLQTDYKMVPVDAAKQYDIPNFKMMIGGHTIMVDEGKAAAFSRNVDSIGGFRSRTGIGYSKDGKTVYLVTADADQSAANGSAGLSMKEFQQFMIMVGVWKGVNLDGGGSTQLISRPLGDFEVKLTNTTEYGTERKIVNGLGVYTLAPQGEIKGLLLSGETMLFLNENAGFQMKAYDDYYNPVRPETLQWSSSSPIGAFQGNEFIPSKIGTTTLTANIGKAQKGIDVEVIGKEQMASMKVNAPKYVLAEGSTYKLPVVVTTEKGRKRTIPANLLQWELIGLQGTINGDTLTVDRLGKSGMGQLIARYDNFSTMIAIPAGIDKLWADFDAQTLPVAAEVYPVEVVGEAKAAPVTGGVEGAEAERGSGQALYLHYDFTLGTGTKAAYAALGEAGNGIVVEGSPHLMKMKVLGDNSLNWLRAEIVDAEGKLHRLDIHKNVNFSGWKELSVNLSNYPIKFPFTMKKMYIANMEQGQDERALVGTVAMDDIKFQYQGEIPNIANNKVKMAVGRKSITVNDQEMQLDQAPVVVKGNTLIPIRFFVDAMGGTVRWDAKEKKVTVIKGSHLIEMWIGNPKLVFDGEAVTAPIAPTVLKGRTVLPLRFVSEKLGWKVSYEKESKSIILQ